MKLNILVVSTKKWTKREQYHTDIKRIMNAGGYFTEVTIDTEYRKLKPEVVKGRITEAWFEKNLSKDAKARGYNFVIFHFGEMEGVQWRLQDGLRGTNFNDNDWFGESWVRADATSTVKFRDGTVRHKYTKVIPHEIAHELKRQGFVTLEIHDYDYKNSINRLEQFYLDIKRPPVLSLLLRAVASLTELLRRSVLRKPLDSWTVTQDYGIEDKATYPLTGHHIGTDLRASTGTPLYAPTDCVVIEKGKSPAMGWWCTVQLDGWYMVCLHLQSECTMKTYLKGEIFAHTGTGGTAPHAHLEGWYNVPDRSVLSKDNWDALTFDITSKFK